MTREQSACVLCVGIEPPEQCGSATSEVCPAVLNERSEFRNRQDHSPWGHKAHKAQFMYNSPMSSQQTREERLIEHLQEEHKQSPLATYIKEVVYGGVDGIITTFAVVAGFSGATFSNEITTQLSFLIVLLFGLANLFADGVSMGLGNFLSVRSDQDFYHSARSKEVHEIRTNPQMEYDETITIMMQKGFSREDAETLATIYQKNEEYWTDFMMTHELEMSDPRGDNPLLTGFATFLSFVVFGFVPLVPFVFFAAADPFTNFMFSCIGTFTALFLLGTLKWKVIGTAFGKSVGEVVIVGGAAATIAFFVGSFFSI